MYFAIKFINFNTMNSQYSKVSQVTDQSFNSNVNQLSNPLKKALNKAQFQLGFLSHFSQITKQNFSSSLSNKVCDMNPQLAKHIRQNTFVPPQSQLIATNKPDKVSGKQFSILDVQEKTLNPLTGSQFAKVPPSKLQHIVYEIKENGSSLLSQSSEHKKKIIKVPSQRSTHHQTKANPPADRSRFQQLEDSGNKVFYKLADQDKQQKVGTAYSEKYSNLAMSRGAKPYKFKQELTSERISMSSGLQKQKRYKYNLFSLLDEIGNNGCGAGFSENELCAPRRSHTQWD